MKHLVMILMLLSCFSVILADRASGYDTFGPITIDTTLNSYLEFRLAPIMELPNHNPVQLPHGGHGFAWYRVEGLLNGVWESVNHGTVSYQNDAGLAKTATIGRATYPGTNNEYHTDSGIVMLSLSSSEIGDGSIGSTGSATVFEINGTSLASPLTVNFQVANIDRSVEWYYSYKIRGGVGITSGVASIGANAEIGMGAKVRLDVSESSLNDWDNLTISRSDDIGAGVEAKLGPPKLGVFDVGAGISAGIGTSYTDEYSFSNDELENGEALYCGYLFLEPLLALAQTNSRTVRFTNSLGEAIMLYSSLYNLDYGNNRLSEEARTTIKAGLNFSAGVTFGQGPGRVPAYRNDAFTTVGANIGTGGYGGWAYKYKPNGDRYRSLFMGGRLSGGIGYGVKEVYPAQNSVVASKAWSLFAVDGSSEFGYELQANNISGIASYRFLNYSGMDLTLNPVSLGHSPDNVRSSTWLDLSSPQMQNIMNSSTSLPQAINTIGSGPISMALSNTSYSTAIADILTEVSTQQSQGAPLLAQYGTDISDVKDFTINLNVPFPILPSPVYVNMGGGISFGRKEEASLNRGYFYKGLPYLNYQGQNYGNVNIQFGDVLNHVWDNVKSGTNWWVFGPILTVTFIKNTLFPWMRIDEDYTVDLNEDGSYLALKNTSLPDTLSEAYCEYWTWQDVPENEGLSASARDELTRFNRHLREYREGLVGMKYGIGGFYGLTPAGTVFADTALISISYTDEEIQDLDESTLAVYWEDDEGNWHYLPSAVYADSNRVEAYIPDFRTYTLAPRMPQGSLNFIIQPDSLAADGVSTATILATNLYNNDGSVLPDGTLFTLTSSRGSIVSPDADINLAGHQISAQGGMLQFEVQGDLVASPIVINASSVNGYANGQIEIPLYGINPPQTPTLLTIEPEHRALRLSWQTVADPGLAGYRIYYNANSSGAPYTGTANVNGFNSPVDVGVTDSYILTGLNNNDSYYVAITAVDVYGLESMYSNELMSQPNLKEVTNLTIEKLDTGVRLTWTPAYGSSSYKIYRSTDPDADLSEMTFVGQANNYSWLDTSAPLDCCFYTVIAVGY